MVEISSSVSSAFLVVIKRLLLAKREAGQTTHVFGERVALEDIALVLCVTVRFTPFIISAPSTLDESIVQAFG
ncbi:hypothetical protein PQR11_28465 [Paraburkholderia strydomiana]|uniref:GST C-terminal domain-containing protein n=1 Tax=Paraburkholderia caledonica TaxID=134536 RepID=A0ABU1L8P0_9BURK|nr:hypothetical protein [Paraburkholderia caledonica]MDR6379578.1 hypothetical protein [Paraburkholderia caledonica]